MSFFFKSSKKTPSPSALPQASRNLKSSDGIAPPISYMNAMNGAPPQRPEFRPRSPTSSGGPVQNGSFSSVPSEKTSLDRSISRVQNEGDLNFEKLSKTPSPDNKLTRERSESEPRGPPSRIAQPTLSSRPSQDNSSPYPWSQKQLTYSVPHAYPFPRYGAAVNAVASRDGILYVMGGLINGSTVKGDLWTIEAGNAQLSCFPVQTTAEGPGPRVGHASLLVGNAFIVFGGDTKTEESDLLDDTLYLLNTSTKQWSRAAPAGPRPPGRYGHTLSILGSKIFIFGGQVEGFFFNDLVAFDLNALQQASNRWEVLIQNTMDGGPPVGQAPPARTNHSMITHNDKLFLFGGTDGVTWFNDVWTYDARTNSWSQLECIGYIPTAREGHSAALVGDVMYVFGGRTEEGNDLGDLAAFKISSRRWYTFQNMGPSPSPRSGHSMTTIGKTIVVLAGEPSSAPRDPGELSLAYFLDTTKIRYPADAPSQTQPQAQSDKPTSQRKISSEKSSIPQSRNALPRQLEQGPQRTTSDGQSHLRQNGDSAGPGSRLPRLNNGIPQQPERSASPPPMQNGVHTRQQNSTDRPSSPIMGDESRSTPQRNVTDPGSIRSRAGANPYQDEQPAVTQSRAESRTDSPSRRAQISQQSQHGSRPSTDSNEQPPPRTSSRQKRYPTVDQETPRPSMDRSAPNGRRTESREEQQKEKPQIDSGLGSSPALSQQHDTLSKELENEKSKNAWYASELALARKQGYVPNRNEGSVEESRSGSVGDDEKPLIEALLKMRNELVRMQQTMDAKAQSTAERIAHIEKQRDMAVNEATFAKARFAAQGGSRGENGYDNDADSERSNDLNRRLAMSIAAQTELSKRIESLTREREAEKRARELAEEGADSHHKRINELDIERQRSAGELESLKAELHESQRSARAHASSASEATSAHKMLTLDRDELNSKLESARAQTTHHNTIMASLQEAVTASADKAALLERKLEQERTARNQLEGKITQLKSQHEERTAELESTSRQLRDAEELAEKHANEARTHRTAVLEGFSKVRSHADSDRGMNDERVDTLRQQVENAHGLARSNQEAADAASEKLRRAEERIAGLEAYQEQTSREGLSIRKQMQAAMKEMRSLGEEKARLQQQLQSQQLEANAIHVQHSALKDVLTERGINPSEVRKNRLVDSPSSNRHGASTPDNARVKDLQDQLEASQRSQEELTARLDDIQDRDEATRKEYEEKLTALDNDHQAAAKYLRGTEKMLSKMKSELQRVKQQSAEYLEELETLRARNANANNTTPSDWAAERSTMQRSLDEAKSSLTSSLAPLEAQISNLQNDLRARDTDLQTLRSSHATAQSDLNTLRTSHDTSRADLERLQRDNAALEHRANEAESKVQMLLDQVESSVDNYRRQTADLSNGVMGGSGLHSAVGGMGHHARGQSTISAGSMNHVVGQGQGQGHSRDESLGGHESVYSTDAPSEMSDGQHSLASSAAMTPHGLQSGPRTASRQVEGQEARERNSMALNSLADELDGLRYRLSGKFDFEKTPTHSMAGLGPIGSNPTSAGGLAEWRKGLEHEVERSEDGEEEEGGFYPGRLTSMRSGPDLNGSAQGHGQGAGRGRSVSGERREEVRA